MLILDNFTHADAHAGNILVLFQRPIVAGLWPLNLLAKQLEFEPVDRDLHEKLHQSANLSLDLETLFNQGYRARMAFLDAGLVTTLSKENYDNFLALFRAITNFDGVQVGELMISRSRAPESVADPRAFKDNMKVLISDIQCQTLNLSDISLGDVLGRVFKLVHSHKVMLDGSFVNIGVSVLLLESIGRGLDPTLDLLKESGPLLDMVASKSGWREMGEYRVKRLGTGILKTLQDLKVPPEQYEGSRVFLIE